MRELESLFQGLRSFRVSSPLHLKLTNMCGTQIEVSVCPQDSVFSLKEKTLGSSHCKDVGDYRVVLPRESRTLTDHQTLEEQGILQHDELVLMRRRDNQAKQGDAKGEAFKTPDYSTIKQLTSNLSSKQGKAQGRTSSSLNSTSESSFDFNNELRKILVSLVEAAQLLQSVSSKPGKENDGKEMSNTSVNERACDDRTEVDLIALKQLVDMGFGEIRARKALILNRMVTMTAMEWLLKHEADPDIDEPVPSGGPILRTRRKREFVPNPLAVNNLKDMGFKEEDIITALKITGNNQEAACEWLLGERKGNIEDTEEGMDTSGQVYTAIMENPLVQLSLANPRILSAFEDMLDNPSITAHYITDPETGPVIIQISRIVQGFSR